MTKIVSPSTDTAKLPLGTCDICGHLSPILSMCRYCGIGFVPAVLSYAPKKKAERK